VQKVLDKRAEMQPFGAMMLQQLLQDFSADNGFLSAAGGCELIGASRTKTNLPQACDFSSNFLFFAA
jgi:hypothetical protein